MTPEQPERPGMPCLEMIEAGVAALHAPDTIVIDHVNWTVRPGEWWVIGGLPASGKSDLLASAAGLLPLKKGVVRLFGEEITRLHEEQRLPVQLRVGIVFGYGGRLFNHMTVAENLALPLCYHHNCDPNASEERVRAVLDTMELSDVAESIPIAINRNLRQRVALARALVLSPQLLLLDNPLAGIDPRETRWWLRFLEALQEKHPLVQGRPIALVISTDDLQPWGDHGRQFAFIERRRFVPAGSRADLLRQNNPALRELLPVDWLKE